MSTFVRLRSSRMDQKLEVLTFSCDRVANQETTLFFLNFVPNSLEVRNTEQRLVRISFGGSLSRRTKACGTRAHIVNREKKGPSTATMPHC